ncbi:PBECR4 domain-containing protein [Blautia sp. An46]|uniref:PBECR4 domain-containing protein n=1 Tax=Blautia sp. An46 TaxID=1965636 RepID=UPI000B3ACB9D|nr:PBECR4 domain-containing protein [Blautia sp. An46]OUN90199.1 hypothetical protein B5G00_16985 [Blautia sp. An46]
MYSATDLNNLTIKPKINDITLEVLREFYEMFLYPFIFTYTVTANNSSRKIKLAFNTRNFCLLLGVESIAKRSVKYSDLHNYRGEDGWNNIKNGLIDIKQLKQLNKKQFNNVKAKYVYFYLLPSLLENPLAVNYNKNKVKPPTNIDCELLFYSTYDNAVIHLGIDWDSHENYYIPRTFFVEKLRKSKTIDIYTENQEQVTVKKEDRIILI